MSLRGTVQNVTHKSHTTYGRRGATRGARTRSPQARLLVGLLGLALVAAAACGDGGESVDNARAAADSAIEQVEELTARIESLESELDDALNQAEKSDRALAGRLDGARGRLDKALDRLRKSTDAAAGAAETAAANSSSALAKAEEAARSLNVLQERYDYHLRRYHGGG